MSQELRLVVKEFISVNHYLGYRAIPKGKKAIVVAYTTVKAKKFKKQFQEYAKKQVTDQEWDIEQTRDKHYYMDCVFYFPRKDMDEQNYFKVLSDSLNGIAYIDDCNILTRTHRIFYDNKNPRIELTIRPVDYIGIFPTEIHRGEFEDHCKECKRYSRNCSILNKAIEGRIQEEINDSLVCSKFNNK